MDAVLMNIIGMFGCLYTGLDCLGKGAGAIPQSMFSDNAIWLWYVIGAIWIFNSVAFAVRGLVQSV